MQHRITRRLLCLGLLLFTLWGSHPALALSPALRSYNPIDGWQYITFGVYPQTLDGGLEPIVWRVLRTDQQTAYVVSEYVLLNHRVHYDDLEYAQNDGDFTKTEIFAFLNGAFLTAFTQEEQSALENVDSLGLMTLLSMEDLKNGSLGFRSNDDRAAKGTPYALRNGLFQYSASFGSTSPYWTRTQTSDVPESACCTKAAGNIGYIRVVVQNEGCRPACHLRLSAIEITAGNGKISEPYQIHIKTEGSEAE